MGCFKKVIRISSASGRFSGVFEFESQLSYRYRIDRHREIIVIDPRHPSNFRADDDLSSFFSQFVLTSVFI